MAGGGSRLMSAAACYPRNMHIVLQAFSFHPAAACGQLLVGSALYAKRNWATRSSVLDLGIDHHHVAQSEACGCSSSRSAPSAAHSCTACPACIHNWHLALGLVHHGCHLAGSATWSRETCLSETAPRPSRKQAALWQQGGTRHHITC